MPTQNWDDYLAKRAAERTPDEQAVFDAASAHFDAATQRLDAAEGAMAELAAQAGGRFEDALPDIADLAGELVAAALNLAETALDPEAGDDD